MLDVLMVAAFIILTVLMVGLMAWAGNVTEEGSGKK